ncbi:MAG: pld 1 [Rickettsiaceae bacterium]|jgi:phospholipase D|nr:pld 1 [Rickettsiaceae bacterium]
MKQYNFIKLNYILKYAVSVGLSSLLIGSCTTLPYQTNNCPTEKPLVCFTPPQGCIKHIINTIESANNEVFVQAYSFTSGDITEALIQAHRRGIKVKVLIDRTSLTSRGSKIPLLINAGIPLSVCKVPGIAHNKVLVIDSKIVITGSYNFTNAAETRNAENLLIIKDEDLAKKYITNWYNLHSRE